MDDDFRNLNDNFSVSEMSASSLDAESVAGSAKSVASTVNTQFSTR
jgi:hypothetical protein